MSHYQFITISPLTLEWADTVQLRRTARRVWDKIRFDPQLIVTETGDGARFIEDEDFKEYGTSSNFAIDNARLLRRDHAYWIRFDAADVEPFTAFCATHGVKGSLSAHVLLGRNGSLSLVTALDFNAIDDAAPFDQRDVRHVHDQVFLADANLAALDTFLSGRVLRPVMGKYAPRIARPRADSTHLVTVLIGGNARACEALTKVHVEEEGNAESLAGATGQSGAAADYVRFGWSYTTLVLKRYSKEIALANLMIHLQNLWFTQKTMREQLGMFNYETAHIRKDRRLAVDLEALNIERTFAGNEVEDYRANLKPWMRSAYDYVFAHWGIGETRDTIERIVADLRAYYERKLDVFESRQSKRQANVLFWIALLQMVALYEGVGAYFSFLDMSQVDTQSIFRSAFVATAVIGSPVALTAVCVYAAYLYFRDDRGNTR